MTINSENQATNKDTWKITIGNINSFTHDGDGTNRYKLEKFKQITLGRGTDIILMSEHYKDIEKLPYWTRPTTLVRRWWSNTVCRFSYLVSGNEARFEPGGTMIITHSRSSAHTCHAEEDRQYLGRWNYITLRGKHDTFTTIISIYRPNKNQETYARQTAYTAKRRKVLGDEQSPGSLWYNDLRALIVEKREQGDFNDDLNDIDIV